MHPTPAADRLRVSARAAAVFVLLLAGVAGCSKQGSGGAARAAAHAIASAESVATNTEDLVHWVPRDSAESMSRASGKPVLYEFSAAWCGPCQRMAKDVFENPPRARVIDSLFVPVKIVDRQREDGQNPPDVDALQNRFHIEAFPTLVAWDPASDQHHGIEGYGGADGTIHDLEEIRTKLATPAR